MRSIGSTAGVDKVATTKALNSNKLLPEQKTISVTKESSLIVTEQDHRCVSLAMPAVGNSAS